jgi:hypothetical protein
MIRDSFFYQLIAAVDFIVFPPNSYVEVLTSQEIVFGDEAFGR